MKKRADKKAPAKPALTHKAAAEELKRDRREAKMKADLAAYRKKYNAALKELRGLEQMNDMVEQLKDTVVTTNIRPKRANKSSEATAVLVASDWHVEEIVRPVMVNGMNKYNMTISKKRSETFFRSGLKLINLLGEGVKIDTIILALLGDFITNYIHEELAEITETEPVHAAIYAQNLIASGIQYILDNSKYNLIVPCHVGNHGRVTKTTRYSVENGHSLEFFIYKFLEMYFRNEPRVKFVISPGYHSYMKIYKTIVRFHHGHAVRYGGGVGGITIPINKKIAQWNKIRKADLDVFGHFHSFFDGGNFIVNGSMIGYNAYALSIGASFEVPKQALFLIDKKRGKTAVWPILFD